MADVTTDLTTANYKDLRKLQVYRLGNSGNSTSTRTYTVNDYYWSQFSHIVPSDPRYIQKIILEEFQPDPVIDTGKIIDSLLNSDWLKGVADTSGVSKSGSLEGVLMKGFSNVLGNVVKAGLTATSAITEAALMEQAYKNPTSLIEFPIKILEELFPGRFLNTYELPYFESKYLQSDPSGSWTAKGGEQLYGTKSKTLMKEGMNIEFPTTPKWSIEGSGTSNFTNFEFYLINDTDDHLLRNYKLIHSIMAGTMWLQLGGVQKSPNVYRVIIPGRDFRFFCSVRLTVTMAGKLRTNDFVAKKIWWQSLGIDTDAYYRYSQGSEGSGDAGAKNFEAIQPGTLFPDAYHLKFAIDELTPNHFNNYINYMMTGGGNVAKGVAQSAYINRPGEVINNALRGAGGVLYEVGAYAGSVATGAIGGVAGGAYNAATGLAGAAAGAAGAAGRTIGGAASTVVSMPSNVAASTSNLLSNTFDFQGWFGGA